jgi:hypothetical protein
MSNSAEHDLLKRKAISDANPDSFVGVKADFVGFLFHE